MNGWIASSSRLFNSLIGPPRNDIFDAMLKDRILSTLKFFDLQDYPVTLLELHKFLVSDINGVKDHLDENGEIKSFDIKPAPVSIDEVLMVLEQQCQNEVGNHLGFYYLAGRQAIAHSRLQNYFYGIQREKLIKIYIGGLKYLPFVRGAALAGSQAMGQEKPGSDIDLLIITAPGFLWLARTLVTGYLQILGKRRYGQNIANRFCLNHYLAGAKSLQSDRNLYTACEYLKLRPLVFSHAVWQFQKNNANWIKFCFPNADFLEPEKDASPALQKFLEKLFTGKFGSWLEGLLKNWQMARIRKQQFIVVEEDELSFHPHNRKNKLFRAYFQDQI